MKTLKNKLHESLKGVKNKKNSLLIESKIVKSRFSLLVNENAMSNQKEFNKMFERLMVERSRLIDQGLTESVINEGILDSFLGIFGGFFSEFPALLGERFTSWLMEGLFGPEYKNSLLAQTVVVGIGNVIRKGEFSKLTDCNFLSNIIADSIIEGYFKKMLDQKTAGGSFTNNLWGGGIVDMIRNQISTAILDSRFVDGLENKISTIICPKIEGFANKTKDVIDNAKTKVTT